MYKFIADVGAGKKIMSRRCWGVSHTPYIGECGTLQMGKINGRMRFARTGGNAIRCNHTVWGDCFI